MAQLPSPDNIARQGLRAVSGVSTYNGAVEGNAIAQFGTEMMRFVDQESARIDDARVEVATNKLAQRKNELTMAEGGYTSVKGDGVISTPKGGKPFLQDYQERFDAAAREIEQELTSPRQRASFSAVRQRNASAFQADLLTHAMRETEAFKASAREGTINTQMQNATIYALDAGRRDESFAEMNAVFQRMRTVDGLPIEQVTSLQRAAVSKFHTNVINKMLAEKDTAAAAAYYAKVKDTLVDDVDIASRIENVRKDDLSFTVGHEVADSFLADPSSTGDVEAMSKALRADPRLAGEPAAIRAAERVVKTRIAERRDSLAQKKGAVYSMMLDGRTLAQVERTPEFTALSQDAKNELRQTIGAPVGYRQLAKTHALLDAPEKLAAMSTNEIVAYAQDNSLGTAAAQTLVSARNTLQKPGKVIDAKVDNVDLQTAFDLYAGDMPKTTEEDFIRAKAYLRDRITEQQTALQRELTPAERKEAYRRGLREITADGFFPWSKTRVFKATPEDRAAAIAKRGYTPEKVSEARAGLERYMGRPPSEDELFEFIVTH